MEVFIVIVLIDILAVVEIKGEEAKEIINNYSYVLMTIAMIVISLFVAFFQTK